MGNKDNPFRARIVRLEFGVQVGEVTLALRRHRPETVSPHVGSRRTRRIQDAVGRDDMATKRSCVSWRAFFHKLTGRFVSQTSILSGELKRSS